MLGIDQAALILAAVATCSVALLLVLTQRLHQRWTADFEASGVQKHHQGSPPRVGAVALGAGLLAALSFLWWSNNPQSAEATRLLALLAVCSIPAVGSGLAEDLSKSVRARWRLVASAFSAVLGVLLFQAVLPNVGVPLLDPLVQWLPVGIAVTVLMVTGFTHAMNIVDGLNGLACGLALMMLAGLGWVAYGVNDLPMVQACAVVGAVLLGFVVVNFPRGALFLGDGGAYFLGFVVSQLMVLLVVRHPAEVSPWCCVALAFHPTMETVFSILRRKLHPRRLNATAPDRLHLHTLIYRRKAKRLMGSYPWAELWVGNALAALMVLALALPPALLAAHGPPESHLAQFGVVALGVCWYLYWFWRMVRSRNRARPAQPMASTATAVPVVPATGGHQAAQEPMQVSGGRPSR